MRFNKGSRSTVISFIDRQTRTHKNIYIHIYIYRYHIYIDRDDIYINID